MAEIPSSYLKVECKSFDFLLLSVNLQFSFMRNRFCLTGYIRCHFNYGRILALAFY